eukprot:15331062-Heterocapsa_arctica.AAC.1
MQGNRRGRSPTRRNNPEPEDGDEADDDDFDEDEVWELEDGFEAATMVDNEGTLVTSTTVRYKEKEEIKGPKFPTGP